MSIGKEKEMDQINDLTQLATTAGCVAFVTILTQYVKPLLPEKLPIRAFVLIACLVIMLAVTVILGATAERLLLAAANAVIAASACIGAYEVTYNRHGRG